MIRLRPWLRLYRSGATGFDGRFIESVLEERALPLDDVMLDVIRALALKPAASSLELVARTSRDKGAIHGALSKLAGIKLVDVVDEAAPTVADDEAHRALFTRLAERTPTVPVVDNVELTNICPMECVMCPTGTGRMTRAKHHMTSAVFQRVVDDTAGHNNHNKPLTLHNLGESALHPQLVEMVSTAARAGLSTELSANPGHLSLALFIALEEAGLTRLVLSVDGVDAETLTRIRGKGARAEQAFSNLDEIFEHRRTSRRGPLKVHVQMIRQRENSSQSSAFMQRFGALGLADVSAYVKEIDANTVGDELYEIGRAARPYLCRAPWRSVVVLNNGDVVPCCHDANGAVVYGNIQATSLAQIWQSAAANALRSALSTRSSSSGSSSLASTPCATCAHRADRYDVPSLTDIPDEPLHW